MRCFFIYLWSLFVYYVSFIICIELPGMGQVAAGPCSPVHARGERRLQQHVARAARGLPLRRGAVRAGQHAGGPGGAAAGAAAARARAAQPTGRCRHLARRALLQR